MTEANALYHFGIKGQRWGVRRFQNADGTLTSDGRKRYRAYKKDWNAYNKLNRHVAASQKHLKEEGVLLDRMKDRYEDSNRAYRKAMSKSSGFLGLKAGQKAQRVANAQLVMDKVGSDYKTAASSYGVAKKIASEDTNKLKQHVNNMIRNYGKGSINELRTETVKIGQNKLQKLLQGAPKSILLSNKRDTEEFIKTGKTLADLPVVGNLYTSNYIAKRELELKKSEIERTENTSSYRTGQLKKNKDKSKKAGVTVYDKPGYLDDTYYDKERELDSREARKKLERERVKVEKKLSKQRIEEARKKAEESVEKVKSEPYKEAQDKKISKIKEKEQKEIEKINKKAQEDIYYTRLNRSAKEKDRQAKEAAVKDAIKAPLLARQIDKGSKKYAREQRRGSTIKSKLAGAAISVIGAGATAAAGPIAGYAARVAIKRHKKKKRQEAWDNFWGIKHSATYRVVRSDELYHHGIKGQRWGVRRYQNSDGTLTAKGRARYYSSVDVNKAFRETKNRPNVIKAKNVARTAAVVTAGFGGLTAGAVTGNPVVLGATPAAYLTAGYLANKAYIQDIKDYNEKYIRSSFTDTNSADDLEKIAPIRRNELKIDKNTEFTRISTKAQEDGKSRLYACLSADKKEIDYYAKDWPKYLEKIKQDPNIKVYKNTYKVNSEIVAPSLEKRKEIAQAILTADKHMKTELGKAYAMDQMRLSTGALYAKKLSDIKKLYATKEARANVDKYYNNMIAYTAHKDFSVINNSHNYRAFAASIPTSQKLMDAYAKELKKQGFNAVYDDNSNAKSAFIFFDQSMLKQLSSEELKHFWSAVLGNELYHVE